GSEGDALVIAVAEAADAVMAARDAQRALASLPLRVRMGLHTGRPTVHQDDYAGIDVHRVARIAAVAHGGQVVASKATLEAAGDDFDFRDLGEHRLKDLADPEWLYQLGAETFPPLRSLGNTNLPVPSTPLVGRADELQELKATLAADGTRLVTITGPGGTGKTRLAIEAAADLAGSYANGVFFVPLASITDAALVAQTIAHELGVTERVGEQMEHTIARALQDRTLLLVLDNFEQVLASAPSIADLLAATRGVSVLVTSREPLRIRGEREYALGALAADDALTLFTERARAVRSDFSLDGDENLARAICERLDLLPLAIELVAARVKLLPLATIAERVETCLAFVASSRRDLPERQRTLRGAIEWSYELLDAVERALFARLAVFRGGWTLEAAEIVCTADLDALASLLDKSLLVRGADDRFSMLSTIREYARERLAESADADALASKHADYFYDVILEAESSFDGPEQVDALERLEREHDNFRAALAWALECDHALAVRLAGALGGFWYRHTHVVEGAEWLERAVAIDDGCDSAALARVLHNLGVLSDLRRDDVAARRWLEAEVKLVRDANDTPRLARALNSLAIVARNSGDLLRARELLTECLIMREELGDPGPISVTTCALGIVAFDEGNLDEAEACFAKSMAIDRERGDLAGIAVNAGNLAALALARAEPERAAPLIQEALGGFLELGDREGLAEALEQTAALAVRSGHAGEGARFAGAASALRDAVGVPWASAHDRERIERELASMRSALGDKDFLVAYEEGRATDPDEAARKALAAVRVFRLLLPPQGLAQD
ncbi:MAG TPA: tetratricopeptide repeat protein, partial [Gaiellaceae bacterium]|nr:tetratricopeptide repeat protein [Gaiellaceae bacterium]